MVCLHFTKLMDLTGPHTSTFITDTCINICFFSFYEFISAISVDGGPFIYIFSHCFLTKNYQNKTVKNYSYKQWSPCLWQIKIHLKKEKVYVLCSIFSVIVWQAQTFIIIFMLGPWSYGITYNVHTFCTLYHYCLLFLFMS